MKRKVINTLAAVAIIAGLALSVTAHWLVVWLVCFPLIYAGAITIIKTNTEWIEKY